MIYYIIFLIICGFGMLEYFRRYYKDLNTIIEVKEVKEVKKSIDNMVFFRPCKISVIPRKSIMQIESLKTKPKLSTDEFLKNIKETNLERNLYTEILSDLISNTNYSLKQKNKPSIIDVDRSVPATLKGYKNLMTAGKYIEMILKTKGEDYIVNLEFLDKEYSVNIDVELEDELIYGRKSNCKHTDWQIKAMHNYYLKNKNQPKV